MDWKADAALGLDVWVTAGATPGAVYEQVI